MFDKLFKHLHQFPFLLHPGTCSAIGEGHYKTFDGRDYTFIGDCRYTLIEQVNSTFSVEVENVQCGSGVITCTRAIEVSLGHSEKIFLVKGGEITVNGVPIQVPKYYANWKIEVSGLFFVFQARIGFQILWDGGEFNERIISLKQVSTGSLWGKCGTQ